MYRCTNHMNTIQHLLIVSHIVSFVSLAMLYLRQYVIINLACGSKENFQQRPFHFSLSAMYHRPACNKVSASAHNSRLSPAKAFCCIPNGSFSGISVRSDRRRSGRMSSGLRQYPAPAPTRPAPSVSCCTDNLAHTHICIHERILCFKAGIRPSVINAPLHNEIWETKKLSGTPRRRPRASFHSWREQWDRTASQSSALITVSNALSWAGTATQTKQIANTVGCFAWNTRQKARLVAEWPAGPYNRGRRCRR